MWLSSARRIASRPRASPTSGTSVSVSQRAKASSATAHSSPSLEPKCQKIEPRLMPAASAIAWTDVSR